jgi:hypothetical protein
MVVDWFQSLCGCVPSGTVSRVDHINVHMHACIHTRETPPSTPMGHTIYHQLKMSLPPSAKTRTQPKKKAGEKEGEGHS